MPLATKTNASDLEQVFTNDFRPPVSPQRNVENFPSVKAKFVRFKVFKTNGGEPCIDELEIFSGNEPTRNLALASAGGHALASGTLPGYQIHQVTGVNDGQYGNGHSWVADRINGAWVQIELPNVVLINRIVWSRDRESFFVDRLATDYVIEVSADGNNWQTVASSKDHLPPEIGDVDVRRNPMMHFINPFGPVGAMISQEIGNNSSEYHIDRWQTEDGLPDNTVTAILQTKDDYLWVGTMGGLVRFDGAKFKRYSAAEGLQNERVLCLYEDRQKQLWVGTDGGGLFELKDGRFVANTVKDGLSSDVVMDITENETGQLWIGTYAGLDRRQPDGKFVHVSTGPPQTNAPMLPSAFASPSTTAPWRQPPSTPAPVSRIAFDSSGGLWNVVGGRLFQLENGNYVMPPLENDPSGQDAIATLRVGSSGRLWLGGISDYVATLNNKVMTVLPQPSNLSPDMITEICETHDGDVWIGTASSGLRRWHDGKILSLTTQEGLSDNSIHCVVQDREGNVWVGTSHGGLNRLKSKKLRLITTRSGLSDNVILSMAEDKHDKVWIGSNGGGLCVENNDTFVSADLSYLLNNACITSLLMASNGDLWVGTWSSGLIRKAGDQMNQFNVNSQWEHEPVLALAEDRLGRIWVGTYQDGLKCFQDGKFASYQTANGLAANYITSLAVDEKDRLWIGTGGSGVDCYTNGVFGNLTRKDGLASDFVRTLYEDKKGVLWIGTSGGLSRLKGNKLTSITRQEGLWDDVISQILEDDYGYLWFGSNRGIFRVNKDELNAVADHRAASVNCLVFGKEEGMNNLECTGGYCPAGLRTHDGRLWFSTVDGLAIVDPKKISINNQASPVILEEVRVNGTKVFEDGRLIDENMASLSRAAAKSATDAGSLLTLKIAPGAHPIEFYYTALSFASPAKVRFQYRMDGIDSKWIEMGNRRVVEYPYLPPGQYVFRVTACNEDGVWSNDGASLALICLPAFWQTWWFRLLIAIVVLSGMGWAVKLFTTRRLKRRIAVLQQQHMLEQERTRIARDIHDELGTLLTEISLLSDHGKKNLAQPKEVGLDLQRISDTAREAVQTADGIVWAITPRNDSFIHLTNYLVHFAEDFFRLTPIRCRLDVPSDLPEIPLSTQHRHDLLLVVKEGCNNVIRHSEAAEMWLRIAFEDNRCEITLKDNGKGFCVDSVPTCSDGLANMRQRMTGLGGQMEVHSILGHGTCVKLVVPLNAI